MAEALESGAEESDQPESLGTTEQGLTYPWESPKVCRIESNVRCGRHPSVTFPRNDNYNGSAKNIDACAAGGRQRAKKARGVAEGARIVPSAEGGLQQTLVTLA